MVLLVRFRTFVEVVEEEFHFRAAKPSDLPGERRSYSCQRIHQQALELGTRLLAQRELMDESGKQPNFFRGEAKITQQGAFRFCSLVRDPQALQGTAQKGGPLLGRVEDEPDGKSFLNRATDANSSLVGILGRVYRLCWRRGKVICSLFPH